eukprot:1865889-Rhodomonas_salina.1
MQRCERRASPNAPFAGTSSCGQGPAAQRMQRESADQSDSEAGAVQLTSRCFRSEAHRALRLSALGSKCAARGAHCCRGYSHYTQKSSARNRSLSTVCTKNAFPRGWPQAARGGGPEVTPTARDASWGEHAP